MKPSQVEVGKTYQNRGAGRTRRTVIAIGNEYRPDRYLSHDGFVPLHLRQRDDPGVLYEQNGQQARLYLNSFAAWCGKEA